MSQHEIVSEDNSRKLVFGWNPSLQTFFVQVHHLDAPENEQIVVSRGADPSDKMPGIGIILAEAEKEGLKIEKSLWGLLYREKAENV